jgi:hypothetical protein
MKPLFTIDAIKDGKTVGGAKQIRGDFVEAIINTLYEYTKPDVVEVKISGDTVYTNLAR